MSEEDIIAKMSDQIDDLNKAVFVGNGHPSLREDMAANRMSLISLAERISKIENTLTWISRLVIGSVVGQLILVFLKLKH